VLGALALSPAERASGEDIRLISRASALPSDSGDLESRLGVPSSATLSHDGRFFLFASSATNLVPGQVDDNAREDLFLADLVMDTTTLVSHAVGEPLRAGWGLNHPFVISPDGRWVAFLTVNAIPGYAGGGLFLYDRVTDQTVLVSHLPGNPLAGGFADAPLGFSEDGRYLLFRGGLDLIPGGDGGLESWRPQFILYDRVTTLNTLVSHAFGAPQTGANDDCEFASLSADGNRVAFISKATNLTQPGTSGQQVFLFERSTGQVRLLSRDHANPNLGANQGAIHSLISDDGAYVSFYSSATNLVAGMTLSSGHQVFLAAVGTGTVSLASHAVTSPAQGGNGQSTLRSISADGRYVAFTSRASNLIVAGMARPEAYVYDRWSGLVTRIAHAAGTTDPANAPVDEYADVLMSADGSRIAFRSSATNMVVGQTSSGQHLFVTDVPSGETRLVDSTAFPSPTSPYPYALGRAESVIVFESAANDLTSRPDANNARDVFAWTWGSAEVSLISEARGPAMASANAGSILWDIDPPTIGPNITPDGRFLLYLSEARNLSTPAPGSFNWALLLHDTLTGTTQSVSRPGQGDPVDLDRSISDDGRYVLFKELSQVFVFDRTTGSRMGIPGDIGPLAISGDGTTIGLTLSEMTSPGVYKRSVYLQDRVSGARTLVTRRADSSERSNGQSRLQALSLDGRLALFTSSSTDLMAGQGGSGDQLFVYDRTNDSVHLVTREGGNPTFGAVGGNPASPTMSADGRFVVFSSASHNLVPGQVNRSGVNLFVHDRLAGVTRLVSHRPGEPTVEAGGDSIDGRISADGRFVGFSSDGDRLFSGWNGPWQLNAYVHDVTTGENVLVNHVLGQPARASAAAVVTGISADGQFILFASSASDLIEGGIDSGGHADLFLFDRVLGRNALVSHSMASPRAAANLGGGRSFLSGDGAHVAFASLSSDLVAGDYNGLSDVYLYSTSVAATPATSMSLHTVTPCRLADTRGPAGEWGQPPLAGQSTRAFTVRNRCGVPAAAKAIVGNLTVTGPTDAGNLVLFSGGSPPLASNINYVGGQTRATNAIVPIGTDGRVWVRANQASGSVHFILDVSGYFE
jgi:Tol biopolymer transport system component